MRFVSAYARMRPWEDFAETFALYLDVADVLDTANHTELVAPLPVERAELDEMVSQYLRLGIAANEPNRSMGLIALVPRSSPRPSARSLSSSIYWSDVVNVSRPIQRLRAAGTHRLWPRFQVADLKNRGE